jgi:ferritin-like protein
VSQSVDDIQKDLTAFTVKINESLKMAEKLIDERLSELDIDLPDDIAEKLKDFKLKMKENGDNT